MARVEPYETGTWKFFCDCEYEDVRFGCSRIVNDSEPNFSCERPIVEASDTKCPLRWKLAPLVAAYEKWRKEEDARIFLLSMEKKRKDALETLGLTEAEVNTIKSPPVSESSSKEIENG